MRYNINRSNVFVVYRNASLADSEDNTNWRNAHASAKACTMCVKQGNTCLHWIVDTYGNIDLGACVWCQERSVQCSIAQQGHGKSSGEKRKRSEKGKEKAEGTLDEDHILDEESPSKKIKVAESLLRIHHLPWLSLLRARHSSRVRLRIG